MLNLLQGNEASRRSRSRLWCNTRAHCQGNCVSKAISRRTHFVSSLSTRKFARRRNFSINQPSRVSLVSEIAIVSRCNRVWLKFTSGDSVSSPYSLIPKLINSSLYLFRIVVKSSLKFYFYFYLFNNTPYHLTVSFVSYSTFDRITQTTAWSFN